MMDIGGGIYKYTYNGVSAPSTCQALGCGSANANSVCRCDAACSASSMPRKLIVMCQPYCDIPVVTQTV